MRRLILAATAASFIAAIPSAYAQGNDGAGQAPDPAQSKAIDEAYIAACSPKAPKELCSCLVAVADMHINDVTERQIFYAYTVGDYETARSQRAAIDPDRNMKFNIALQNAETMVHNECDKFRPRTPAPQKPQ
ncbi:hypothetical protein [Hansschlegelia plantiphila]|uniref:Uncharacterized protein n=1 Tax=Hansschlegelia plantiphila TaxID=374655 RepID=A0A9W6J2C7_9HYPH|nr:hypothetical protein [Hansschlegelia plantiphila]GLK69407.1 hypothetical protein GCM10008179_30450 [Hansschlegelia plantiphila]